MIKRLISIALVLLVVCELTGCEALQRKFTRKKKREPLRPRFYQEGEGETRPHLELYMMHYTYWKTWQEDMVVNAGKNSKRDALAREEMLGNLSDMRKHLKEEKAKELDAYIEEVKDVMGQITKGGTTTSARLGYLRQKLDNIRGRIVRNFYYKKIRDDIKPD